MPVVLKQPRTKIGQGFADIAPLIFLYDANDAARYYNNNDAVSNLFDLSGNNSTMTQSGSSRPTLVTNRDGFGNAALVFNGTSQYMATASNPLVVDALLQQNVLTWFAVVKVTAATGSTQAVMGKYSQNNAQEGPILEVIQNSGSVLVPSLFASNAVSNNYLNKKGGTNILNIPSIIFGSYNTSPLEQTYTNGSTDSMTLVVQGGDNIGAFNGNTSKLYLGAISADGDVSRVFFLAADLYLVGCYLGVLSSAQRSEITNRLSERFQISVA